MDRPIAGARWLVALLALAGTGVAADPAATPRARVEFRNEAGLLPPGLPFSEAVRVDGMLYLSGQVGISPGKLDLVPGGITAEARQVMDNVGAILKANGLGYADVVKCTAMLADMNEWGAFNAVYRTYFHDHFPARSAFGATGLALGARVELECVAALPR